MANINTKIEDSIYNCKSIQSIADDILDSIEQTIKKDTINSIDGNVGELHINTVIDHYLQAINLSYDISEDKEISENTKLQMENIRFELIKKRNKAIEIKGRILSKDENVNNNTENQQHTTLLTISECVIYKWKEDNIEQKKALELTSSPKIGGSSSNKTTTATNKIIIEKQIIGSGTFYLKKANDKIHYIQIKFQNSLNNKENQGINGISNQTFILTSQTPILIHSKGHYVIKSDEDYFGLLFPNNIPLVYIDILERKLESISFLITLPNENEITTTTTTTTTTTNDADITTTKISQEKDTLIIKDNGDTAILEKDKDVGTFVVNSLKSATNGVDSGSQTIAACILSASSIISLSLRGGGYKLMSTMEKNEKPAEVSPIIVNTVEGVKSVTSYAKQGSSYIIGSLSSAVATVGGGVVNLVRPSDGDDEEDTNCDCDTPKEENIYKTEALNLGKTTIKSIGSIIGAIGDGISMVYDEATGTTVDLVNYKYGEHAAKVTDQTISISKDVFDTAMSVKNLPINVVKGGGKMIIENNFINKETTNTNNNENLNDEKYIVSLEKKEDFEIQQQQQQQQLLEQEQQEKEQQELEKILSTNNEEEILKYTLEKSVLFQ
ncbi:hypothetical protein ACTFIU_005014 [Dictyostelium citrinum]